MDVQPYPPGPRGVDMDYAAVGASVNDGSGRPSASTVRSSESISHGKVSGTGSHRGSHDSKPRLSKDQHERLEREFHNNRKPSTAVKKQFSQQLGISLEKVNNWFQNRRAKVKHEEKKGRNNLPAWGSDTLLGLPLSEYGFLNDAFLQIQDPSHASQHASFQAVPQSGFPMDGQYANVAPISDCPTIHEEPNDASALMSFMGIDPRDGRHPQLRDIDDISKQFNPRPGPCGAFVPQFPVPAAFAHLRPQADSPFDRGSSAPQFPQTLGDNADSILPATVNSRHMSSSIHATITAPVTNPMYDRSWMIPQVSDHVSHPTTAPFGLDDAREMVNQLQARASQADNPISGHQAFSHPTALTNMAVPQPVLPSQPPLFEAAQQRNLPDSQPYSNSSEHEKQPTPEEPRGTLSRTDSGTSILAESMGGVAIDPSQASMTRAASRTPSLSFAQRRQKRPANITAAGPRSHSCAQAPLSASDRSHPGQAPADPHLRRIKSSSGVLNGRIQKSSGQRSPLYQSHFADSHPHLPRQLSTNSLNAALQVEDSSSTSAYPPMPPPSTTAMHMQHPSNSSGLTHMTIPEDPIQTPESVWSRMPGTADTTATSFYYSVPHTATTAKSYMSPPRTPMDHQQFASMQLRASQIQPSLPPDFPPVQYQPVMYSEPAQIPHNAMSLHEDTRHAQPYTQHFSTEDLVMNTIPVGQPPPHYASMAPEAVQAGVAHSAQQLAEQTPPARFQADLTRQDSMISQLQEGRLPQDIRASDFSEHSQHQQFVWNLQPGTQHVEQRPHHDLQIHHFTPSNPVDPSNLPPKQKQASPRQTYSFQNYGPDYYCSPKSQSSQSKASSPGHLQTTG